MVGSMETTDATNFRNWNTSTAFNTPNATADCAHDTENASRASATLQFKLRMHEISSQTTFGIVTDEKADLGTILFSKFLVPFAAKTVECGVRNCWSPFSSDSATVRILEF